MHRTLHVASRGALDKCEPENTFCIEIERRCKYALENEAFVRHERRGWAQREK
ncbi:hypothetical protein CY34DRAFT_808915 [Suillus luteus UH-Slu-Lm8-n1]|uniref:Uncharacterized protein n=1 Tax=Suillus luteus UH-Slu-Lm8-n1 TaxID=930992 RepID=A0A0D0B4U6_9AGAM|nr:hypothetical protein CY34DRAFT_808915 [Suillus luteus UH-Slu-Lm8-n1]